MSKSSNKKEAIEYFYFCIFVYMTWANFHIQKQPIKTFLLGFSRQVQLVQKSHSCARLIVSKVICTLKVFPCIITIHEERDIATHLCATCCQNSPVMSAVDLVGYYRVNKKWCSVKRISLMFEMFDLTLIPTIGSFYLNIKYK